MPGRTDRRTFCHHAGSRADRVYVPQSETAANRPIVVVLQRCTPSAGEVVAGTQTSRLADEHGFIVVYPEQAVHANASRCWNWFKREDQLRGAGEPALIAGMVRAVAQAEVADPRRIFVAGLSAGSAMAGLNGWAFSPGSAPKRHSAWRSHQGLHSAFRPDQVALRQPAMAPDRHRRQACVPDGPHDMTPRSYLFVPADRPERFDKALGAGADAVIIDLEDAVAPAAKTSARDALANWLDGVTAAEVTVRLNAPQTAWFADDLRACAHPRVRALVLPKAERRDELAFVATKAPGRALLPLIESAAGFEAARTLAGTAGVTRLVFGSIDFQADLGIEGDDDALLYFRSQLVLASRLAGLDAPVDGVTTALGDEEAITRDTARARRLGFGAKLCIHPKQVAAVNRGFLPGEAELEWAHRVLAAAQDSGGAAVAVDGRMVDAPVLLRARRLIERAER